MRKEYEIDFILSKIKDIWMNGSNKHLRLGQLLYNISEVADKDIFYIEDNEWHEIEYDRGRMFRYGDLQEIEFNRLVENPTKYEVTSDDYNVFIVEYETKDIYKLKDIGADEISGSVMKALSIDYLPFDHNILDRIIF